MGRGLYFFVFCYLKTSLYKITRLVICVRPPYLQRLCLRSGGLLKPRPVHLGKRNIKTYLHTLMSRHHCANIVLPAGAL